MRRSHIIETTANHDCTCSICKGHIREFDDVYIRYPDRNEIDGRVQVACYRCAYMLDD